MDPRTVMLSSIKNTIELYFNTHLMFSKCLASIFQDVSDLHLINQNAAGKPGEAVLCIL